MTNINQNSYLGDNQKKQIKKHQKYFYSLQNTNKFAFFQFKTCVFRIKANKYFCTFDMLP